MRRFRFAPTPSRPLHLGNALAALIGWGAARAEAGAFVLRIEDIDRQRCRPEFEEACLRDLEWLGLDWDEGPDVGGEYGPYRQSERLDRYDQVLVYLHDEGAAYPCRCSRADVRAQQSAPHLHQGGELPYPGTCRRARSEVELAADRGGYRFDVMGFGEAARVAWDDDWLGPQEEDVRATCGDFLLGRPGTPTYQLAVVADDRAMQVSDVIRGHDLTGSTARQLLLHRRLGDEEPPRHAHHPLLLDAGGRKLAKRDRALSLSALREDGVDAQQVIARVAASVGLLPRGTRRARARDLVEVLQRPALGWRDGALLDD